MPTGFLTEEVDGKRPLRKGRRWWDFDMKRCFKEKGSEGVGWINPLKPSGNFTYHHV
jgi:hypothetical protein